MKRTMPVLTRAAAFLAAVRVFRPTCTVERQALALRRRGAGKPSRAGKSGEKP